MSPPKFYVVSQPLHSNGLYETKLVFLVLHMHLLLTLLHSPLFNPLLLDFDRHIHQLLLLDDFLHLHRLIVLLDVASRYKPFLPVLPPASYI